MVPKSIDVKPSQLLNKYEKQLTFVFELGLNKSNSSDNLGLLLTEKSNVSLETIKTVGCYQNCVSSSEIVRVDRSVYAKK